MKVCEQNQFFSQKEFTYQAPELKPMREELSSTVCLDILLLQAVDWGLLHGVFAVNVSTMLLCMGRLSRLYPLPLPYPEALRRQDGGGEKLALKRGVCALVIVLNYLHLGRPRSCAPELKLNRPLSKKQWRGVQRLERMMEAWIFVSPIDAEAMGRTAAKVESLEEDLARLEAAAQRLSKDRGGYFGAGKKVQEEPVPDRARGFDLGFAQQSGLFSTFKQVDPDRLAFVGTPSFDPRRYLDERGRKIFEEPIACRLPASQYQGGVPRLKVHCSSREKIRLFELLDSSGRLGIHRSWEVEEPFGSGLFSVVKDLKKDRLILDSRGANKLEAPAQRWIQSLACGEALVRLLVGKDEIVKASGNDLRDFYYLFQVSEERSLRNYLVGAIHAKKLSHLNAVRRKQITNGWVVGSLRTLAMGDCQAVELAQTCHLSLSLNARGVTQESLISMHQPLPRCKTSVGIIIDDYVALSLVHKDDEKEVSEGAVLADSMFKEYQRVKLIPHESKAFRDSTDASFWGLDLDGKKGIVRGSMKRAIPLVGLLLRVAKLGVATGTLLETLTGSVISLFLYRRRFLSLLDSLFGSYFGRKRETMIGLDGRTKSDLLIISCLMPVAASNLRAKVAPRITASDASSWGEAAVVSSIPQLVANELYRHTLKKSLWVRLLRPFAALLRARAELPVEDEVPDGEKRYHSHPLWQSLAEGLNFTVLYSKQKSGDRHINIGELRGMLRAEEKHAFSTPESREIYGLDSQVVLGSLIKGRSSSASLNAELSRSIPVMVLQDMYSEGIYFESSVNPADDPTRGKELRTAQRRLPPWWDQLARGEYEGFDAWMRSHDSHPDQIGRLPPFSELLRGEMLLETEEKEEAEKFTKALFEMALGDFEKEEEKLDGEDATTGGSTLGSVLPSEAEITEGEINAEAERREAENTEAEKTTEDEIAEAEILHPEKAEFPSVLEGLREEEVPAAPLCASDPRMTGAEATDEEEEETLRRKEYTEERSKKAMQRSGGFLTAEGARLLRQIPKEQFVGLSEDGLQTGSRCGFLDLFSGWRGVAQELHRLTGCWVLCYDLEHSAREDLDNAEIKLEIEAMLWARCFLGVGGGPVCGSFSMAVTPAVRSTEHPYGKPDISPNMKIKTALGNRFCRWMIKVLEIGLELDIGVWLENPASSWFFRVPVWRTFEARHSNVLRWTVDYCRFYARWRKRTAIYSNTMMGGHRTLCKGGHQHVLLRGRCKEKKKAWTALAQAYPRGVAFTIAACLAEKAQLLKWNGTFDPAQCARCGHRRIGEAQNPGPRGKPVREGLNLGDVKLVEAKTLAIQNKAWGGFLRWVNELLSPGAVRSAMAHPALLADLLREYGHVLYGQGGSLYLYRHLVVFVQQQVSGARGHLGTCWDTIARREICEPVEHRTPLPFPVFLAMLGVSLAWKWRSFAAILGLAYYGISRPGEPLKALRSDLVLPSDRLEFSSRVAYLQVRSSKSRRKGKGAVQHLTIDDEHFVQFLERVYHSYPMDRPLFLGSPAVFRRRWDAILAALRVDKKFGLTPGGLRGGGCVHAFQQGCSIPLLMWRMRLRHQVTLESYLQEVIANSLMAKLAPRSRLKIQAASSLSSWLLMVS